MPDRGYSMVKSKENVPREASCCFLLPAENMRIKSMW